MEEDIRRNGKLYLHQKRFGKRWRKVWCVLVAEGRCSVARLELYENQQMSVREGSSKSKPDYKQVIRLRECIRISENKMADCPKDCATFCLETSDKLYMFAAPQSEVKEWIMSLCEQAFPDTLAEQRFPKQSAIFSDPASTHRETQENSLYDTADSVREFLVIAVGTEAAVRCNLYGEYILSPQPDGLLLKDSIKREVLLKWPYCYVRKFGQDMLTFSFEAGRRCKSGEGNFEFATNEGERLFSIVSAAIQNLPKTSAAKQSNFNHDDPRVREPAIADKTYDDISTSIKTPDCSPKSKTVQHKMLSNTTRSVSLNVIPPSAQAPSINTSSENEELVYAVVTKAQLKATSSTDPQAHRKNLNKASHQSGCSQDFYKTRTDISQASAFAVSQEEEVNGETVTRKELLSDSIHQLAINDAFRNIGAEAIYADPVDFELTAGWGVNAVYDNPEEPIMANQRARAGADRPAEHDFLYRPDVPPSSHGRPIRPHTKLR